jgi:hypothetical protein
MDISPTMHQAVWCCHNVLEEWFSKCALSNPKRSADVILSSYYKLARKHIEVNVINILQNLFIWNSGVTQ